MLQLQLQCYNHSRSHLVPTSPAWKMTWIPAHNMKICIHKGFVVWLHIEVDGLWIPEIDRCLPKNVHHCPIYLTTTFCNQTLIKLVIQLTRLEKVKKNFATWRTTTHHLASLKPDFHGKHLMLEWTSGKQEKVTPDRGNANHIDWHHRFYDPVVLLQAQIIHWVMSLLYI